MLTLILSLCAVCFGVLSALILYANYRDPSNRWLSIFTFAGFLWVLANLFANISKEINENLIFSRAALVGASLVPLAYLFFCLSFTQKTINLKGRLLAYTPIVLLLLTAPTKVNVVSVSPKDYSIQPGVAYLLLLIVYVVYFSYGLRLLSKAYRNAKSQHRQQLYYILVGTVLTIIPGLLLSAILPLLGYASTASFSPVVSIIFVLAASVAILRHHLFDIRLLVIRAAAYGFTTLLIGVFCLLPSIWLFTVIANAHVSFVVFVSLTVLALMLATIYRYLKALFDRLTKHIFYRHYYDPQDVLDRLGNLLAHTIDLLKLQNDSRQIIKDALNVSSVEYVLQGGRTGHAQVAHVLKMFPQLNVLVIDELGVAPELVETLRAKDAAAVVRLRTTHGELGHIVLGSKLSGEPYFNSDKRLLGTIADEVAITIQNALHFDEIQNFNKTLQERVDKATKELRRTNDKLKALDETKDEFITMASHQLRTPLTSVKGYLSMVLEGDAGKLNANQAKLLQQSYISSQRMVYLISDLLNLSRLNTGRFVIESTPVDLGEVVQGEIDQLAETAKSRDLTLAFKKPASLPLLMLDETKIHQVVMNLMDNAIYYTPAGGKVTVELRETPTAVEYMVHDTGIGVPKDIQHKLFTKFYRAQNAQQARPDGTGLGLFMARKVVAAQGGSIIFDSVEGKGSTFGFRFSKARHLAPAADARA